MQLPKDQSDYFFQVYYPLLYFSFSDISDKELSIGEFIRTPTPVHVAARNNLYENRGLIDEYIGEVRKTVSLDKRRLSAITSFKNARFTDFFVVEKEGLVYFVDYRRKNDIYLVSGLSQDIKELFPNFPCQGRTALIQFEGTIVSDGLIFSVKTKFPKNTARLIMRDFERDVKTNLRSTLSGVK